MTTDLKKEFKQQIAWLVESNNFAPTQAVPQQLSLLAETAKAMGEKELSEALQQAAKTFMQYLEIMKKLANILNSDTSTRSYTV